MSTPRCSKTAAGDAQRVGGAGVFDAQGDVGLKLAVEAVADVAAGDVLAVLAGEGGIVDGEDHVEGGLVDVDEGQGFGAFEVGDGVADVHVFDADDGADVAGFGAGGSFAAEALEEIEIDDLVFFGLAVALQQGDRAGPC